MIGGALAFACPYSNSQHDRRHFLVSVGVTAIPSVSQSRKPPKGLFRMADQLRFSLSCRGNKVVETSHLDRPALKGTH